MTHDMVRAIRELVRGRDRAALATALPVEGGAWPYASLVLVAVDHDLSPVLLLSELAEHTKAIAADGRVSLLFDGTEGLQQPLTGTRVTLLGRAERSSDERLARRFLARHPEARTTRVSPISRSTGWASSGRMWWPASGRSAGWRPRAALPAPAGLAERRDGIVRHMNEDHADALHLYAGKLLGRRGALANDRHRCRRARLRQAGRVADLPSTCR